MGKKKHTSLNELELSAFCQQIAMILNAGLPTYYGISLLLEESPNEQTRSLLADIYKPMEAGCMLHQALADTKVFPVYMVHMIELGETTGRLEEVLLSLSTYYEREAQIRNDIRNAITYPLLLTFMMVVVIIVLLMKVLPVFSQIYEELGTELTDISMLLMNVSNFLNRYIVVLVIAFIAILIVAFLLYRSSIGKTLLQGNKLAHSIAASRFSNCMYLALASGLDTDRGLELAELLVDNPHMIERIARCKEHIKHGEGLAKSLMLSGIYSKTYSSWILIGYKTGAMDDVMKRICTAYEEETDARIHRFISVLEPTLVIVLCVFIGLILVSFLLPLLGILSSIG